MANWTPKEVIQLTASYILLARCVTSYVWELLIRWIEPSAIYKFHSRLHLGRHGEQSSSTLCHYTDHYPQLNLIAIVYILFLSDRV